MLTAERDAYRAHVVGWLRTHGVAPTGKALAAALAGARHLPDLYAANTADGVGCRRNHEGRTLVGIVRDGDYLRCHEATVVGDPIRDPETGGFWLTLTGTDGTRDVELSPATVVDVAPRRRTMPPWLAAAHAEYRLAREAWEARRDEYAYGYATERREYADRMAQADRPDPAPRFRDFVKEHASRLREEDAEYAAEQHARHAADAGITTEGDDTP